MITENDKQQILKTGIITGKFTLASGIEATQKFDFDLIEGEEFAICIDGLVQLIKAEFPSAESIVTIANGATRLGDPIAAALDIQHVQTSHNDVKPRVFQLIGELAGPVVIVDDVFTKGTTIRQVGELIAGQPGANVVGAVTVLNRSAADSPTVNLKSGQVLAVKSVIHYNMEG